MDEYWSAVFIIDVTAVVSIARATAITAKTTSSESTTASGRGNFSLSTCQSSSGEIRKTIKTARMNGTRNTLVKYKTKPRATKARKTNEPVISQRFSFFAVFIPDLKDRKKK